jgi:RND family efflux transporter MFP subunit
MKQKILSNFIGFIVSIAVLAAGILGGMYFIKSQPEAQRRRPMSSMVPVVETVPFKVAEQTLKVDCLGTVIADTAASLQAQVNGRIIEINPRLVEGELVQKGDILVQIEEADYHLALAKAEASLLTAQTKLRIEEGQQDAVRHELELMGDNVSGSHRDLMLREPQLKSAQAAVKSAELAVESAKLNLERTTIRAPYDAVVVRRNADEGDFASANKVLVELASTERYFIRASVPLNSLDSLPKLGREAYSATVTLSDGSQREAKTYKLLPDLSERGRMARILLTVDDPFGNLSGRQLLLGEYVRVAIEGEPVDSASLIERKYLRDGNVVWMIGQDNKLRILDAEVLQGYEDEMLIRVQGGQRMEIVTTDMTMAVDGMELRRVGDPPPARGAGRGQGGPGGGKGPRGGGGQRPGGPGPGSSQNPDGEQGQPGQKKPGA